MDLCGIGFMGNEDELFVRCVAHPATGHLLFGRMLVGEKDINEKIVRWQLSNMVRDCDGKWEMSTKEYAYEKCIEEEIMQGLLILLGVDEAKLKSGVAEDDVWNSLRYVYAGDWTGLMAKEEKMSDRDLWEKFVLLRSERKELLEQLSFESVLDYYQQCLILEEDEYISVFKRGKWEEGDVKCLLELLEESASGYFATDYIRENMFGRDARETRDGLMRIWGEFFNLNRWLEWARKQNSHEIFCVLEGELENWLNERKRHRSQTSAEMMVWRSFGDALEKQLESCRDAINYGSGVAENKVLSCWESLYTRWMESKSKSRIKQ